MSTSANSKWSMFNICMISMTMNIRPNDLVNAKHLPCFHTNQRKLPTWWINWTSTSVNSISLDGIPNTCWSNRYYPLVEMIWIILEELIKQRRQLLQVYPKFKFVWLRDLQIPSPIENRLKQNIIKIIIDKINKESQTSIRSNQMNFSLSNASSSYFSTSTPRGKRRKLFHYDDICMNESNANQ